MNTDTTNHRQSKNSLDCTPDELADVASAVFGGQRTGTVHGVLLRHASDAACPVATRFEVETDLQYRRLRWDVGRYVDHLIHMARRSFRVVRRPTMRATKAFGARTRSTKSKPKAAGDPDPEPDSSRTPRLIGGAL